VIRTEGLEVQAGDFTLRDVSFEVKTGGYGLVIGPTGSGKTTLLEAIAGLSSPRAGRVWINDREVTNLPPEERRLGFVYQQYHLFPHLSVRDNIGYGLAGPRNNGTRAARIVEVASLLGIGDLLDRGVARLSGGEQQRIAMARALAPRPSVLLLDEPFAAVDPATRRILRRELRLLHEREGITTLQVTHDFDDALRLGDHVAVLSEGRIVQQGTPEEVFRFPNSTFVAQFVGAGNVLAGVVEALGPPEGVPPRFRALFRAEGITLDLLAEREGPAHAIVRPEDILVSRVPYASSARNRLEAAIVRLERLGPVTHVYLDAGRPLVAAVTSATAEEMGLKPGERVAISFKAMAVHLV
jgi:molybdopterin-binding protein